MKRLMLGNILLKMDKAYFVVGLGYGDEGKGSIVDFLTEKFNTDTIVRFNGGSQAAHNVINGQREHCFSQFGSGTFIPGTKTYLSPFMYIDPISLVVEEEALRQEGVSDAYSRLFINENCNVITPFQKYVGRMRELVLRNSSCGMGVGETVRDSIVLGNKQLKIGDLKDKQTLEDKLDFLRRVKLDQAEQLLEESQDLYMVRKYFEALKGDGTVEEVSREYQEFASRVNIIDGYEFNGNVIFEGAQGILLDVQQGFYPFVTKTDSTLTNAERLVNGSTGIERVGVLRGYSNRHGKGPFVSEEKTLNEISKNENNCYNVWQGDFRVGWFDLVASKYALNVVGGVDCIALTNLDCLKEISPIKVCIGYQTNEDVSEDHFVFERRRDKTLISAIITDSCLSDVEKRKRTSVLMDAHPIYREFKDLDGYLKFLESEEGLGVPIGIKSYGPSRSNKILNFNL